MDEGVLQIKNDNNFVNDVLHLSAFGVVNLFGDDFEYFFSVV